MLLSWKSLFSRSCSAKVCVWFTFWALWSSQNAHRPVWVWWFALVVGDVSKRPFNYYHCVVLSIQRKTVKERLEEREREFTPNDPGFGSKRGNVARTKHGKWYWVWECAKHARGDCTVKRVLRVYYEYVLWGFWVYMSRCARPRRFVASKRTRWVSNRGESRVNVNNPM